MDFMKKDVGAFVFCVFAIILLVASGQVYFLVGEVMRISWSTQIYHQYIQIYTTSW